MGERWELHLSPEQRRHLSLEEGEALRPLSCGAGAVLLERTGSEASRSWPRDRALVLTADVRAFSLADVLGWIHAASKSGFLAFDNGDHSKNVYLHRGEVVFAASNQKVDRLGECLLRAGTIAPEQYREAKKAYTESVHFGKVLVEKGFLSPQEIWNGVKHQVEEIVRSLFSYGAGTVLFWEGEVRPDNVVRLALPTQRLVAEGLRRRDDLLKLVVHLEDPAIRIEPVPGANLRGTEGAVYRGLECERGFPALCGRTGFDPLTCARAIQVLRMLGAVRLERREEADGDVVGAPVESDVRHGDDEAVRECVRLHAKLLSELSAPIVAVEGGERLAERLGQVVQEASARFPELLGGLEVGSTGSLDPEWLIERALRFPGERESEVRQALGELVSYLEFELVNHPRIDDPHVFLRAVDPLRDRL